MESLASNLVATPPARVLSAAELAEVQHLYDAGLMLQAHRAAEKIGPLRTWSGTAARILAGRLAGRLGDSRLGGALHQLAYRSDRADFNARYYRTRRLLEVFNPYEIWRRVVRDAPLPPDPGQAAEWFGLRSSIRLALRDFDGARQELARSEQLAPDRDWLLLEKYSLAKAEYRDGDALELARALVQRNPAIAAGQHALARTLTQLERIPEAIASLEEACTRFEDSGLASDLARLYHELEQWEQASSTLRLAREWSPLSDSDQRAAFDGFGADLLYFQNRRDKSIELARKSGTGFHKALAERLATATGSRRVMLPLGFVKQVEKTCVPASMAMLCRYWSRPGTHDEIAREICWDGTQRLGSRRWLEQNGWLVREFRVDRASAFALIERGVPFILNHAEAGEGGHVRVAFGFDEARGTISLRDPGERLATEFAIEAFCAATRADGPMGTACVPVSERHRLEGLVLPEAELYEVAHAVEVALEAHDVAEAERLVQGLTAREETPASGETDPTPAPTPEPVVRARAMLAFHLNRPDSYVAGAEAHARDYPDHAGAKVALAAALERAGRVRERRALIDRFANEHRHPVSLRLQADELRRDARRLGEARQVASRGLRARWGDAAMLKLVADLIWAEDGFEEATEAYRFAACLDDFVDGHAYSYFLAARWTGRIDEGLAFLRARFERHRERSASPGVALARALLLMDRAVEAIDVLRDAQRARPDDLELLLYAAPVEAESGDRVRARAILEQARSKADPRSWRRVAARVASAEGDAAGASALWRQIAEADPRASDALAERVAQIRLEHGGGAAVSHLRAVTERDPDWIEALVLLVENDRMRPPAEAEAHVRALLALDPLNAWAHRELGVVLQRTGRFDEAAAALAEAIALTPQDPSGHGMLAALLRRRGELGPARASARRALERDVDYLFAVGELIAACPDRAQRREELEFLQRRCCASVVDTQAWLELVRLAPQGLDAEPLAELLDRESASKPGFWHLRAARVRQLVAVDRKDHALEAAMGLVHDFPTIPGSWHELARVEQARENGEGRALALTRAAERCPGWSLIARERADLYEDCGEPGKAREELEAAVRSAPGEPANHGFLADLLWKLGEKDAAVVAMTRALRLQPGHDGAWSALASWSEELGRPGLVEEVAEEIAETWAEGAADLIACSWRMTSAAAQPRRLRLLELAIEIEPRSDEAHEALAETLSRLGRHDEARAACRPEIFGGQIPCTLRGREAAVEWEAGNRDRALELMRQTVATNPDYLWGWHSLADWYAERGEGERLLEVGDALVGIDPTAAGNHNVRVDALLRLGRKEEAKATIERSLQLDPTHEWTLQTKMDLELAANELEAASETLKVLCQHHDDPWIDGRAVQLHARRGDWASSVEPLERLGARRCASGWPAAVAVEAAVAAGWTDRLEKLVERTLRMPNAVPGLGTAFVAHLEKVGDRSRLKRMLASSKGLTAAERGVEEAIESALSEVSRRDGTGASLTWIVAALLLLLYVLKVCAPN